MDENINGGAVNGANNNPAPQPQIPHDAAAAAGAAAADAAAAAAAGIHEIATQLLAQGRFDDAFRHVLNTNNAAHANWVCAQVNMERVMSMDPLPLSTAAMTVLLRLLIDDLAVNTQNKIIWITYVVSRIDLGNPETRTAALTELGRLQHVCRTHQAFWNAVPNANLRILKHVLCSVTAELPHL